LLPTTASISLRPLVPEDEAFLFDLFSSDRGDDLAKLEWPADRVVDFLSQQYSAQQRFFRADYPHADQFIVLRAAEPIGTIVVARDEREIRVVDIALMPPYRNAGIGTYLIKELLAEAGRLGRVFRVQVMRSNPAVGLFERLGLVRTGETGSHYQMEWSTAL
jgi:ribosomal protein S18 acetylase RimI-like enzyme